MHFYNDANCNFYHWYLWSWCKLWKDFALAFFWFGMIFLANAPFSRSVQSTILTRCWPRLPPPLGMKMSPCSQVIVTVRVRNRKIFSSFCHLNVAPVAPKWLIPCQLVHLGGVPASLSSSAFFVARLKWNEIRGIKKAPDANFGTGNNKNFLYFFFASFLITNTGSLILITIFCLSRKVPKVLLISLKKK